MVWTKRDENPNLEIILGVACMKVLPFDPTNIIDVVNLFKNMVVYVLNKSSKYCN